MTLRNLVEIAIETDARPALSHVFLPRDFLSTARPSKIVTRPIVEEMLDGLGMGDHFGKGMRMTDDVTKVITVEVGQVGISRWVVVARGWPWWRRFRKWGCCCSVRCESLAT